MKNDQPYTPKYWVLHNIKSDDVFIKTASKSFGDCAELSQQFYPEEYERYLTTSVIQISLIEVKLA